jgi:hypothetical protein
MSSETKILCSQKYGGGSKRKAISCQSWPSTNKHATLWCTILKINSIRAAYTFTKFRRLMCDVIAETRNAKILFFWGGGCFSWKGGNPERTILLAKLRTKMD